MQLFRYAWLNRYAMVSGYVYNDIIVRAKHPAKYRIIGIYLVAERKKINDPADAEQAKREQVKYTDARFIEIELVRTKCAQKEP